MSITSTKYVKPEGTLLLSRSDVARLLSVEECIVAVEEMFRAYGQGRSSPPALVGIPARDGGFHIKAGLIGEGKSYFVGKINANFPQNAKRFGLPTIQGVIVLSDGEHGYPLGVFDSIEITIRRTGAATAVAAKYLSRKDSRIITICGCGNQGRNQLESLLAVRDVQQAFVFDLDGGKAQYLADEFADRLSIRPISQEKLSASLRKSDICVTCTPSRRYYVDCDDVAPGTFVAGVGADNEDKQELDPRLFVSNKAVADILDQSATIGDLHHALALGFIQKSDVYAELGEIVAGVKPGRVSDEEITIFDSTGMALQDAAAAVLVYEKAISAGIGKMIRFN